MVEKEPSLPSPSFAELQFEPTADGESEPAVTDEPLPWLVLLLLLLKWT